MKLQKYQWTLQDIWNESIDQKEDRKIEPRNYLYASEVGGSIVDTYLKLQGMQPTNPYDIRSRRKFEAGNFWEWAIRLVLIRSGLLKSSQDRVWLQYPGLLPVSGRLDFLAGGKIDWVKAKQDVEDTIKLYELPEFMAIFARKVVDNFSKQFPDGIDEMVIELKSCSSFMYEMYDRTRQPDEKHKLQCFHYILGKELPEGHVVYVCKDDVRMLEFPVLNTQENEDIYKGWIEKISYYYNNKEQPPKEKEILFSDKRLRFESNWKIEYSPYLTYLYGYSSAGEFSDVYRPMVERWNRVLTRIAQGKDMTANNNSVLGEMREYGFDIDSITSLIVSNKDIVLKEGEQEDGDK